MIRFSFTNVLKESTMVSASSANLAGQAENCISPTFGDYWLTAAPFSDTHYLTFNFPLSTVSCFGLFGVRTSNTDSTLLIQLKRSGNVVKEINTTTAQVVYGYGEGPYGLFAYGGYSAPGRDWMQFFRVFWFEDIDCDEVYIEIGGTNEVQIGYVHLGPSWSPPFGINADYSSTFESVQLDTARNYGGVTTGQVSRYYRCINVTLQLIKSEDLQYILSNLDASTTVVFSGFAEQNTTKAIYSTILGKIPDGIKSTGAPHKRFNVANLKIEECK